MQVKLLMNTETMVLGQSRDKKLNVNKRVDHYDYSYYTDVPENVDFVFLARIVENLEENLKKIPDAIPQLDNVRLVRDVQTGKWNLMFTAYIRLADEIIIDWGAGNL